MSACFHWTQRRRAKIQESLSEEASLGLGCLRLKTVNCCLSAKFSRRRFRRERKQRIRRPSQSRSKQAYAKVTRTEAKNTLQPVDFHWPIEFWRRTGYRRPELLDQWQPVPWPHPRLLSHRLRSFRRPVVSKSTPAAFIKYCSSLSISTNSSGNEAISLCK